MKAVLFHIHDDAWLHRWAEDFPELQFPVTAGLAALAREIADADILLLTNRAASVEAGAIIRAAPKLKWIHFLTAGFDRGIAMGLPENVRVSYSAGIRAPHVAEHALALTLALFRALPAMNEAQKRHLWLREEISAKISTLNGATIGILGLGHVGREVARRLSAFGAQVIGISRSAEPDREIGAVYRREDMHKALAISDALVLCAGAEEETKGIMDRAAIFALKKGAYLVNVARGSLIDEKALTEALHKGHLRGAALDVQQTEPLPPESPLWDLPNVIVSPHSAGAGASSYFPHRALFRENFNRFMAGRDLVNQFR